MKKILMLALVAAGLFSGCKKDDGSKYYQYIPPYSIYGLTDLKMQKLSNSRRATVQTSIGVAYNNGEQERVSLSLEDVPQGLYDTLYNPTGYPSFNSQLYLIDSGVAAGEYTIKVVAQGERSGRRDYPVKITVLPTRDCSVAILGSYTKTSYCTGNSGTTQSIIADANVRNRVVFPNLDGNGTSIYADVDCDQYSGYQITIPSQTVNGKTYTGNGYMYYYNGSTYASEVRLNVYQTAGSSCSYSLIR